MSNFLWWRNVNISVSVVRNSYYSLVNWLKKEFVIVLVWNRYREIKSAGSSCPLHQTRAAQMGNPWAAASVSALLFGIWSPAGAAWRSILYQQLTEQAGSHSYSLAALHASADWMEAQTREHLSRCPEDSAFSPQPSSSPSDALSLLWLSEETISVEILNSFFNKWLWVSKHSF